MALNKISIVFLATAMTGCAMNQVQVAAPNCERSRGYSEMRTDGTLVVHLYQDDGIEFQETYVPSSSGYGSWVIWAGNPRVGERKTLPIYSGVVRIRPDGIMVISESGANVGGLISEPTTRQIDPGTPEFQRMSVLVGGLGPGEFRGIPSTGVACSSSELHG